MPDDTHDQSPAPENPDPRGENKRPEQSAEPVSAISEMRGSENIPPTDGHGNILPVAKPTFRAQREGESDDEYLDMLGRYDVGAVDATGAPLLPNGSAVASTPDPDAGRTILGNTGDDTALQETRVSSSNTSGATVLSDTLAKMDDVHAVYATRPAVNIPAHGSLEERAANVTVHEEDAKNAAVHATLYTDPSQEKRDSVEIARAAAAGQGRMAPAPTPLLAASLAKANAGANAVANWPQVISPAEPGEGAPAAHAQVQSQPIDLATPEGGVKHPEVVKD